jgi:hypothetical protein
MPHDARLDAVFVQHSAHLIGGQIDVGLAVVTLDEAVAIAMAGYGAFKFCEEPGRGAGVEVTCFDKNLVIKGVGWSAGLRLARLCCHRKFHIRWLEKR